MNKKKKEICFLYYIIEEERKRAKNRVNLRLLCIMPNKSA